MNRILVFIYLFITSYAEGQLIDTNFRSLDLWNGDKKLYYTSGLLTSSGLQFQKSDSIILVETAMNIVIEGENYWSKKDKINFAPELIAKLPDGTKLVYPGIGGLTEPGVTQQANIRL